jgi:formylglycine-generating enzyme required for sulfatase activity
MQIIARVGKRILITGFLWLAGSIMSSCSSVGGTEDGGDQFNAAEFRDCADCPLMIELRPGSFLMGTAEEDRLIDPRTGKPASNDGPQHRVDIEYPFALGKYEVTTAEFGTFVSATGYKPEGPCMEFSPPESFSISGDTTWSQTGYPQTERSPVVCVSYYDALAYVDWLSERTQHNYRIPSEAEWEYAARAGSNLPYFWGDSRDATCSYANVRSPGADTISDRQANADKQDGFPCDDGFVHSSPVGSFAPNAFGLHDMQGNAWEWVADCNHKNYVGAPADGSAWLDARGCQFGVIRSGSFLNLVERSSTTVRAGRPREGRATNMGFRIARDNQTAAGRQDIEAASDWADTSTKDFGKGDSGAELFQNSCSACHVRHDDFRGAYGTSQQDIENTIRNGGNNIMSMPAFGQVLADADIRALAIYIRQKNGWD